jgi:hemolysin III
MANTISHGLGLAAALVVAPLLVIYATRRGTVSAVVGTAVFGLTLVAVYLASTIYHALPESKAKRMFLVLDQSAIFALIAGTYTPFTLGVLRGGWGWTLLVLAWSVAVAGVILRAIVGVQNPRLLTCLYLGAGWLALIAIRPLWLRVPVAGLVWITLGGIAYTGGIAFLAADRVRYSHFVWHLFVLAGSLCHILAVLWYSA